MNFEQLITAARARVTALQTQRAAHVEEQRAIMGSLTSDSATLGEADQERFDSLSGMKAALTADIGAARAKVDQLIAEQADDVRATAEAEQRTPGAVAPAGGTIRTEDREDVYTSRRQQEEGTSFLSDLYARQFGKASRETLERMDKHERQVLDSGRFSKRAVNTGSFAGAVPPQYLVDETALLMRAGRPTADIVRHLPLPADGMSLVIPRGTTGVSAAVQATQNTAVSNTDAVLTDLTIPVVTIAGQQDVSRQAIERGQGVDQIIWADLVAAYNVALDQQVISGTGTGGQMLGILNTAGVTQMSAFTAAATATSFYSKIAGALVAIAAGRFLPGSGIIVHPRRWGWLTSLVDAQGRPLVVPNYGGPFNAIASLDQPLQPTVAASPNGWLQGVPVYTDANIPTAVGTGPEDQVIVARVEDLYLWEDASHPTQLSFEQTLGANLTVKLVAYGYAAFTAGRYPLATSIVGGNAAAGFGLIAPTF